MTIYFISKAYTCKATEHHAIVINSVGIFDHYNHTIHVMTMDSYFHELYPITKEISEDEFNYAYSVAMEKIKEVANG